MEERRRGGDAGGRTREVLFAGEAIKVDVSVIQKASDLPVPNFILDWFSACRHRRFSIFTFPPSVPGRPQETQRVGGEGEKLSKTGCQFEPRVAS
jgi:hypothetical protein